MKTIAQYKLNVRKINMNIEDIEIPIRFILNIIV